MHTKPRRIRCAQSINMEPVRRAPLLTQAEVAEMLATSHRTLEAWRGRGGGPPFLKLGHMIRYDAHAVDAWIEARSRKSTSDDGAGV